MAETLRITLLLFRTHLVRVWTSRRALACLLLGAIPPGVAALVGRLRDTIPPESLATHLGWLLVLQVIVPLVTLVAGSAVVAEEVEDRTLSYLFSRPIPRPAVLLGRWLATLVLVWTVLLLSTGLMLLLAARPGAPGAGVDVRVARPLLEAVALGAAVYSALFAVAGVFLRHPMIAGLGYAFAIEGFLANLPGKNQALTIQYHLRSWIAAHGSESWRQVEGFAETRFESGETALRTLLLALLVVLLLGAWRIARREFVLSA